MSCEMCGEAYHAYTSGKEMPILSERSNAQKLDLARTLHYDYRSSNGQIRHVLGLNQYDVDQLFKVY